MKLEVANFSLSGRYFYLSLGGETGRHTRLKILGFRKGRADSISARGTTICQ